MREYPFIVDAHVHFWDPRRLRYPWLDSVPALNKPFLPADLDQARGLVSVEKLVFVEAGCEPSQSADEVHWISHLARSEPRIRGIVASVPLEKGTAARTVLLELALNPLVKGIRRNLQGEADPQFCLQPNFMAGVQLLAEFNLSFDLCITHHQMPAVIELVRECPHVRFILDHIGKPAIREQILDPWRQHLKALSALPNVWCKLSGLVTEADHQNWQGAQLEPYVDHVINCFGFDRVVYGGDWPVSTLATDYQGWVDTLLQLIKAVSEPQLDQLFRTNAEVFYRI
jgi:L-fuconolactonase